MKIKDMFVKEKEKSRIKTFVGKCPKIDKEYACITKIYKKGADEEPMFCFRNNGEISLDIIKISLIVIGALVGVMAFVISVSSKYKRKYKKKITKLKDKIEKAKEESAQNS